MADQEKRQTMVGPLDREALELLRELGVSRVEVDGTKVVVEFSPPAAPPARRKPSLEAEADARNAALASSGYVYDARGARK